MNLTELAIQLLICPSCKADPGQPCRTRSGRKLTDNGHSFHRGRPTPLYEVWRDGYAEASENAREWRQRALDRQAELANLRATLLKLGGQQ